MYKTIAVNSPKENEPEKRKRGRPKKINAGKYSLKIFELETTTGDLWSETRSSFAMSSSFIY
ncbi:hypothetical protein BpHYR1_038583 [Brachionus plicatilis]|uniref:Uncharacterized protein n=1 Tax=Brachionus plicatilis TaxID=10195 RepID=A0A3M7PXZ2_BRAPC|nr:hypothetical protein BpHYR1_038583 [Brachionus plicatilis]